MIENLPTIDIAPDLVKEIEKINKKLRSSNKFTDDNGVLIGSNWINWKKEKPAIGEWFIGICRIKSILMTDEHEYEFVGKLSLENSLITLEIKEENLQFLLKTAFNVFENIIYWKEYDNDTAKNQETSRTTT